MKTNYIVLFIILGLVAFVIGGGIGYFTMKESPRKISISDENANKNKEDSGVGISQTIDCGKSDAFLEKDLQIMLNQSSQDKVLSCFGEKILDNCTEAKIVLSNSKEGDHLYEIEKKGSKCILRTTQVAVGQVVSNENKKLKGMYQECSIDVINKFIISLDESKSEEEFLMSAKNDPGNYAISLSFFQAWMMLEFADSQKNEIDLLIEKECSGPLFEETVKTLS
jgi:hypothetical protein